MKPLLVILFFVSFCGSSPAQIIDMYGDERYGSVPNAYYKDVNGFLDQYLGTWLYTNGTTSLKVMFQKREHKLRELNTSFFHDLLIGEYQYIENGVEKVNTLAQINTDFGDFSQDMGKHNLLSIACIRFPQSYPQCNECSPNERRLEMTLSDPTLDVYNTSNAFVIRSFTENGQQKLKVWFYSNSNLIPVDADNNPVNSTGYQLPYGEYVLIKQ